ncbi:hypothetical protein LVW35_14370 [Pseudomonas sp. HN11]|uniref:hypothetical protein n=1 Tax=Pseudomonas sp. HN11 TaxID=1344094 RepID=UPI001F36E400|nr:hypothetical protein [Pseudomonas sp. HN11]UII68885.1 hypothetical protein LVW35_14370 [Pseudomonas sp. HN11]
MSNTVALNTRIPASPTFSVVESTQTPENTPTSTSEVTDSPLRTKLGHKQDLKTLGQKLNQIATQLGKSATPTQVASALTATLMDLHPDSSHETTAGGGISIAAFIQGMGLPPPTDHFSLTGLAKSVNDRSMEHPLGNLGGALSWPVPLNADEQERLRNFATTSSEPPLDVPRNGGLWALLERHRPASAHRSDSPASLLDALLGSPQAQSIGQTLQEKMQGVASTSSDTDYLLAALALQLDPESITSPHRNRVAGFGLANPQHFGKPASAVVERLRQHLISQGKVSPAMAAAGTHLLLAGKAPMFLIKDIPDNVTYGSPAWLHLAVAAATIEAQTPGKLANMTFAQVMFEAKSAGLADLTVTENAQKVALVDWGVANGVIPPKDFSLYTSEDLATLIDTFNQRNTSMMAASQAMDKELPSRREMALAVLKERFPDKEELFEQKVISVMTSHVTHAEGGKGVGYGYLLTGQHSMLDIAMMDLKHPNLVFRSKDSRIPVEALNANNQFGVADAFNKQFAESIQDKKNAVSTTIKHLISQLPVEDRNNFEYGAVSFYQTSSRTLSTGFTGSTQHPPEQPLLVSINRNGITTAYKIDFSNGVIAQIPNVLTKVGENRDGRIVRETKAFKASDSEAFKERTEAQPEGLIPNTFSSPRTQAIADTFVQHLDLDNPQIKTQASGITTEDRRQGLATSAGEFLLDLIPFRSAIVNFQKGQYGEGAFDLALDVFGFLTAGAGTLGKVAKAAGSAASAVSKAFKVAKVIGVAAISELSPLNGLGDLAIGTTRLTGNGLKFLGAHALQGVNKLRGANGSYDLLKAANKEHGPTLIGRYKVGEREIEGAAVLKNDRWYKYDHVTNTPFGLPIDDFVPKGAPLFRALTAGPTEPEFLKLFRNLTHARSPANLPAFNRGYLSGQLESLPDYQSGMGSTKLRQLAEVPNRPPEELGILARELKRAYISDADYTVALLRHDAVGPGVSVVPSSQMSYNAHVDLPSVGECAGMSYAMALALSLGTEDQFLKNMLKAANDSKTPAAAKFVTDLRDLQDNVKEFDAFHYGKPATLVGYDEIIDKMLRSPKSTTIRIGTHDHAMLAGTRVTNGKPEWFFYDPNMGLVKFTNLKSMEAAMESLLNSGPTAALRNTDRTLTGHRAYTISVFDPNDVNRPGIDPDAVKKLSSVAV